MTVFALTLRTAVSGHRQSGRVMPFIFIRECKVAGNITGISFHCCQDSVLVSYTGCVLEICKYSEEAGVRFTCQDLCITGVLSLCPVTVITAVKGGLSFIIVLGFNPCVYHAKLIHNLLTITAQKYLRLCSFYIPLNRQQLADS